MRVTIRRATPDPIDAISEAAGTSYGRNDASWKRVKHCFDNGHMSVFEFADATFLIEGISRACSHQLVRHRHMSFVQQSQRYTTIEGDDWYVVPPNVYQEEVLRLRYERKMRNDIGEYQHEIANGIKPEDARFLLPEATKTDITVKTNVRELFHFLDLRCDKAAQWEIRDLALAMRDACKGINSQWAQLIELWEG